MGEREKKKEIEGTTLLLFTHLHKDGISFRHTFKHISTNVFNSCQHQVVF